MAFTKAKTYEFVKSGSSSTWTEITGAGAWQLSETPDAFITRMNFDNSNHYMPNFFFNASQRLSDLMILKLYTSGLAGATYDHIIFCDMGRVENEGTGIFFLIKSLADLTQFFRDFESIIRLPFFYHQD